VSDHESMFIEPLNGDLASPQGRAEVESIQIELFSFTCKAAISAQRSLVTSGLTSTSLEIETG